MWYGTELWGILSRRWSVRIVVRLIQGRVSMIGEKVDEQRRQTESPGSVRV